MQMANGCRANLPPPPLERASQPASQLGTDGTAAAASMGVAARSHGQRATSWLPATDGFARPAGRPSFAASNAIGSLLLLVGVPLCGCCGFGGGGGGATSKPAKRSICEPNWIGSGWLAGHSGRLALPAAAASPRESQSIMRWQWACPRRNASARLAHCNSQRPSDCWRQQSVK